MSRFAIVLGSLVENVIVADNPPVVAGRSVVALTTQAVGPGDSYDGSTFTPRVPSAVELVRGAAPGRLQNAYATLRQWSIDAQATYDAATAANRALTAGEQREFIRRVGVLLDRMADMLATINLDGG